MAFEVPTPELHEFDGSNSEEDGKRNVKTEVEVIM